MLMETDKPRMKLGVTGGIGSGKTSVCRVFGILGIPVFSADAVARDIMDTNPEVMRSINKIVGLDVYPGGILDRMALASLIFRDSNLLDRVNSLVHPVVFENFMK